MESLNKRGHHADCTLSRSLYHMAEALEAAEKEPGKTVGKSIRVTVIHEQDGMGQFLLDNPLMQGWKNAYRDRPSTQSLDKDIARTQALQALLRHTRREEEKPRAPVKMRLRSS